MNHCVEPMLVALDGELPDDPSRAGTQGQGQGSIGCNRVICDNCGALVRHVDHHITREMFAPHDIAAIYDSGDPASRLQRWSGGRTYLCRCSWLDLSSGAKNLGWLDYQNWSCGGHAAGLAMAPAPSPTPPPPATKKTKPPRPPREAVVAPVLGLPEGPKLQFHWGLNVDPTFATVRELRDSLLASYPDAAYFHGPFVGRNRDDTAPAWGWVPELIRIRSDWWPAIGIALQHAVADGGELAQVAFAMLVADFRDALALLPWTEAVGRAHPALHVDGSACGWAVADHRLDTLLRSQRADLATLRADDQIWIDRGGRNGADVEARLRDDADLRGLLELTARAGRFPERGPWSWLDDQLLLGAAWLRPALCRIFPTLDELPLVLALLDWMFDPRERWLIAPQLRAWRAQPPAWWTLPATTRPRGWRRAIRPADWLEIHTLGDVVERASDIAEIHIRTAPVIDLPVRYL